MISIMSDGAVGKQVCAESPESESRCQLRGARDALSEPSPADGARASFGENPGTTAHMSSKIERVGR
jgi:hypothetical protein